MVGSDRTPHLSSDEMEESGRAKFELTLHPIVNEHILRVFIFGLDDGFFEILVDRIRRYICIQRRNHLIIHEQN